MLMDFQTGLLNIISLTITKGIHLIFLVRDSHLSMILRAFPTTLMTTNFISLHMDLECLSKIRTIPTAYLTIRTALWYAPFLTQYWGPLFTLQIPKPIKMVMFG